MSLEGELLENLSASLGKYIVLKGGYYSDYAGRSGMPTILKGTLRISAGKLAVDGVVIQKP